MTLREFTAWQPSCDAPNPARRDGVCGWVIEHDGGDHWFLSAADAIDLWRDEGGWTDQSTFICEDCLRLPHTFIPRLKPGWEGECDRCGDPESEHSEVTDG